MKKIMVILLLCSSTLSAQDDAVQTSSTSELGTLDLETIIQRTIVHSKAIERAQHDLNAQVERTRSNWANVAPRVQADYNELHFKDKLIAPFGPQSLLVRDDKSKTGTLSIVQPITGLYALSEKAHFEEEQKHLSELDVKITTRDLSFSVAEVYVRAIQAKNMQQVLKDSVFAVEQQRDNARILERAGRITHADTLRFELALSEAKAAASKVHAQLEILRGHLAEVIGEKSLSIDAIPTNLPELKQDALPSPDILIEEAQRTRLDLDKARSAKRMVEFGTKLAYAQFSPQVNLFARWEKNFGELTALSGERVTPVYGVQVTWQIWNNGSQIFDLRESFEREAASRAGYEEAEKWVRLDALKSVEEAKSLIETRELAKVAVQQAEETYRIEEAQFRTGNKSSTDLVLTHSALSGARGRFVSAQADLVLAHFQVQKARGVERPMVSL